LIVVVELSLDVIRPHFLALISTAGVTIFRLFDGDVV
jgi:hypothetical protein